jgi:hypothetical protein
VASSIFAGIFDCLQSPRYCVIEAFFRQNFDTTCASVPEITAKFAVLMAA